MKPVVWLMRGAIVASLSVLPTAAYAHSPVTGLGTFYGYLLHPVSVLSHALLLIGTGLMLGQQGREIARRGLPSFGCGLITALGLSRVVPVQGVAEHVLLVMGLVIVSPVIVDRRIPALLAMALATAAGFSIGLDSGPDTGGDSGNLLALAGVTLGALYPTLVLAGLSVGLAKTWQRVGIRVAASWVAAACLLVLSLTLASSGRHVAHDHPRSHRQWVVGDVWGQNLTSEDIITPGPLFLSAGAT
jgi:urease accessory protein